MDESVPVDLNTQLRDLYKVRTQKLTKRIKALVEEGVCKMPANPLLLEVPDVDRYRGAGLRGMFIGQETNEWCGKYGAKLDTLTSTYRVFFGSQIRVYDGYRYPGAFWNGLAEYRRELESASGLETEYLWNNILKVGKNGKGTPCDEIIDAQIETFNVPAEEIQLLRPQVVVFFTGPDYDKWLDRTIPDVQYRRVNNRWNTRQLAQLESPKLPALTFRTYHPNYLNRDSKRRSGIRNAICRKSARVIRE